MQKGQYDVLIIRGAPGVGKTTLSKLLKRHYTEGVTIEVDTLRLMVNGVKWVDKREHLTALRATAAMCDEFLSARYSPIIVVDTLGYARMKQFHDIIVKLSVEGRPVRHYTTSLFCDEATLENRIRGRKSGFCDLGQAVIINKEMKKPRFPPETCIDTTKLSPKETYETILSIMEDRGI